MPKEILTKSQVLIEEYLTEEGFSKVEPVKSGQLLMRGEIITNSMSFDTLIEIKSDVPASYPKFYTIDNNMVFSKAHIERPEKIPKLGTLTGMCFKKENEKIYCNSPVELIHRNFAEYEKLCIDISSEKHDDMIEILNEFDSYWPASHHTIYLLSEEILHDKKLVPLYALKDGENREQLVLTDDIESINKYVKNSKFNIQAKVMCPYLDIGDSVALPFPYKYNDLHELFTRSGHIKYIRKLQEQQIGHLLLVGVNLPDGKKHYTSIKLPEIVKGSKKVNKNRCQVFFNKQYKYIPFEGMQVKSIQRSWLMHRGGDEKTNIISQSDLKIAILGCGSIGSNLAYKLCKNGINNLVLIDPGNLHSSNIGRHFLGMNDVGRSKVEAMQELLQSQFISIDISAYKKKAQYCMDEIRDVDLIIGAIGSDAPSVEPYLSDLVINEELPPMITCWLEANAIAGHAFYIDNTLESGHAENMMNKLEVLNHEFASSLLESEVGCSSDFMAYSHNSADDHVNKMTKFILETVMKQQEHRAISSYSDIDKYKGKLLYSATSDSVKKWKDNEIKI